jgi:hypothetical protein
MIEYSTFIDHKQELLSIKEKTNQVIKASQSQDQEEPKKKPGQGDVMKYLNPKRT